MNIINNLLIENQSKKLCLIITVDNSYFGIFDELNNYGNFDFIIKKVESSACSLGDLDYPLDSYNYILIDNTSNINISASIISLLASHKARGYKVVSLTSFYEYITGKIPLLYLERGWLINPDIFFAPRNKHFNFVKRLLDLTFSIIIFPFAIFLIFIGAIVVKLSSRGPLFFKQERVGKNGRVFVLYKLRTMKFNASSDLAHTSINDKRIFPSGNILRKTKIDELPQIWNIIKGEMSYIGPRPERSDIVHKMNYQNPYYNLRHLVRPGLSGWAQVNNPKATPNENLQKLEFDLFYIKNMSYFLELKIFFRTMKIIFTFDSL